MQSPIYTNTTVKIYAKIKDEDGNQIDPDGIDFFITWPGIGTTTIQYSYGNIDGTIQKTGSGSTAEYFVEWLTDDPGKYKYTWETTGTVQTAFKSFFEVENSRW